MTKEDRNPENKFQHRSTAKERKSELQLLIETRELIQTAVGSKMTPGKTQEGIP